MWNIVLAVLHLLINPSEIGIVAHEEQFDLGDFISLKQHRRYEGIFVRENKTDNDSLNIKLIFHL